MSDFLKIICKLINKIISFIASHILLENEIKIIMRKNKIKNRKVSEREDNWARKWMSLQKYVNRKYYRTYSCFIGEDINIVPDDICHNIIMPILNPKRFVSFYGDKCLFDRILYPIFHEIITPVTLLRNIGDSFYYSDYSKIDSVQQAIADIPQNIDRLIIKKSLDTSSGKGIAIVARDSHGLLKDIDTKEVFSEMYLKKHFQTDFVVQKVMRQSAFMAQFCKTSVNTIRILVYRSIKNNTSNVINAILRIGKDGTFIDNAHSGGMFIGVNRNGVLGKYCCNQFGERGTIFNGVDFSKGDYQIPNYNIVKQFAEKVADSIHHQRLVALDIMLDVNNLPILIEYNLKALSVWLFQFTNGTGFGEFTDEIIDYCKSHIADATRVSVIF